MKNSILIILSVLVFASCGQRARNTESNTGSGYEKTDSVGSASDTSKWDKNKTDEFVLGVASDGLMEVQLGQMAQKMATTTQVGNFGKLMEKDHSDANQKLKKVAQSMQLNIPTTLKEKNQDKIDNLKNKKGKDFDKEYMDEMVNEHKDDIDQLEEAQNKVSDPDLRAWITNTLPILRNHLQQAETVREQLKNMEKK